MPKIPAAKMYIITATSLTNKKENISPTKFGNQPNKSCTKSLIACLWLRLRVTKYIIQPKNAPQKYINFSPKIEIKKGKFLVKNS